MAAKRKRKTTGTQKKEEKTYDAFVILDYRTYGTMTVTESQFEKTGTRQPQNLKGFIVDKAEQWARRVLLQ